MDKIDIIILLLILICGNFYITQENKKKNVENFDIIKCSQSVDSAVRTIQGYTPRGAAKDIVLQWVSCGFCDIAPIAKRKVDSYKASEIKKAIEKHKNALNTHCR